jgi:hypothetical protein
MVLAVILGPIVGETEVPVIEWGISTPAFGELFRDWTFFGVGVPPRHMVLRGLPMVFSAYVILFGDMIQSQALLEDAGRYRPDEKIDYNPNRSHIVFGLRNTIMSILGPDYHHVRTPLGGDAGRWCASATSMTQSYGLNQRGRRYPSGFELSPDILYCP